MSREVAREFNAPDGIEPIVGWRIWILLIPAMMAQKGHRSRVLLHSLNHEVWSPRKPFKAGCKESLRRFGRHGVAPESSCRCGIYAIKGIEQILSLSHFSLFGPVLGEVSLWGKIVVHDGGYRAQYAYPKSLWVLGRMPDNLVSQLDVYGVPVGSTQDSEFRWLVEQSLQLMIPDDRFAAEAFLDGVGYQLLPPVCCEFLSPNTSICPQCDLVRA
jgi:hypothetical protein